MKTVSAGMATHLALSATTLVTCWKLKRVDNVILGFTEHDIDIIFDLGDGDGSITYQSNSAYNRSAIQTSHDLKVDNLEVESVFDSTALTVENMRAGIYDFAEVKIFLVNWKNLNDGSIKLRRGTLGQLTAKDELFIAELRGLVQAYSQEIIDITTPDCRADLGDLGHSFGPKQSQCKVQIDPPEWVSGIEAVVRPVRDAGSPQSGSPTQVNVVKPSVFNDRHFKCTTDGITASGSPDFGEPDWNLTIGGQTTDGDTVVWETIQALKVEAEIASVISNQHFTISYTGDASDALLTGGLLEFNAAGSPAGGGNNAGLKQEIKLYGSSTTEVFLYLPMPFNFKVGGGGTSGAFRTTIIGFEQEQAPAPAGLENKSANMGSKMVAAGLI